MGRIKEIAQQRQEWNATRWFRADVLRQLQTATVDSENGAIYCVAICTVGEAKGHGVFLEQSFIEDTVKFGNQNKQGVKCRFGHPSMSGESLGTFVGRYHNFRVEGNKAIADLYLDETAKKTPSGDLYSYVLDMAEKNPDMFGASIVFKVGEYYYYNEDGKRKVLNNDMADMVFVKMASLQGCDLVDEPAANDSLFSSTSSNSNKFAVIASQFLDAHPQILDFISKNPHKITEFLSRYTANQNNNDMEETQEPIINDGGVDAEIVADNNAPVEELPQLSAPSVSIERFDAVVSQLAAVEKLVVALTKRVTDLEETPADSIRKPKPKSDAGQSRAAYSWELKARQKK